MTTPEPRETPIQRFRVPLAAWVAFGNICRRRGVPRARRLFDLMWVDVHKFGTEEERRIFLAADKELRQRRSRKRSE